MYENKLEDILKAQSGNKEVMSKIIMGNSNLIWSIASRFKDRGYEMQDLYQIGCIGLIKSIKRFDTNFEVKLSTYAVPYILGEIKRFIRDDGGVKKVTESTAGLAGIKSTIKLSSGEALSHEAFVCSNDDLDYPYIDIALGADMSEDAKDSEWVIVQGKSDGSDETLISIESENKVGMYVTVNEDGLNHEETLAALLQVLSGTRL